MNVVSTMLIYIYLLVGWAWQEMLGRLCFEMSTNCIHCCPDSAVTHWSPAILPPYDKNIFGKRCLASVESGWDGWKWGPMGAGCV